MKRILLVGLLLPISMTMAAGEKTRVTVLDASSANYLEVKDNKGVKSWIRVNGVLCDEPDTYYGKAAKRELLNQLKGKRVSLELGNMDDNGIRTANIIYRKQNMNAFLLRTGLCELVPNAQVTQLLDRAQRIAIARKQGRWGNVPIPDTSPTVEEADEQEENPVVATARRGFDNQSFFYTIAGMGFLALMIVISRKRAAVIKRAKEEERMAELIREKNEELGGGIVPVDLTNNVLVSPLRANPPQPQKPCPPCPPAEHEDGERKIADMLTDEDRDMLEKLPEDQQQAILDRLKQQDS
ncbi:thermonuclease family protein [Thiolapillus sp.]|uniref:thermonuclease family protein n=1 Tax=Thiolapillus sp. TaxID=2017437 RepID=UPI003AF9F9AE